MALSLDDFAWQLTACGIVSDKEVTALRREAALSTPQDLARQLIRRRLLTPYQAKEAYAGRGQSLTLGKYLVLDRLGQGGMGVVLKARHRQMDRVVALKVLSPSVVKTPTLLARFRREMRLAARLEHPNLVSVYDADEDHGTHFFVMQYVEGRDLSALVKASGVLSIELALGAIVQAAQGLEFAHSQGVIHRDIKPANLFLDNSGTVKILDLGLARIEGDAGTQSELTTDGAVMGTVDYMAPEQALNSRDADARSDVYSLGVTLWYLLIGRPVFPGTSLMARLVAHREAPIPSLRDARSDVSLELDALFRRMLAKSPSDRIQSMTEVLACLERMIPLPMSEEIGETTSFDLQRARFLDFLKNGPSASAFPVREQSQTLATRLDGAEKEAAANDAASDLKTRSVPPRDALRDRGTASWETGGRRWLWWALGGGALLLVGALWLSSGERSSTLTEPTAVVAAAPVATPTPTPTPAPAPAPGPLPASVPAPAAVALPASIPAKPSEVSPPAFAESPFDAQRAAALQEDWAQALGVPVFFSNEIGMRLRVIPPGEFMMGTTAEEVNKLRAHGPSGGEWLYFLQSQQPTHPVRLTHPFAMSECEVTVGQFGVFVAETKHQTEGEKSGRGIQVQLQYDIWGHSAQRNWRSPGFSQTDESPVVGVSWNDAVAFCEWLSRKEKRSYRLATEAEWEYACRAGTTTATAFGLTADATQAVFEQTKPRPVGTRQPNPFGLYDMHGNVHEWCRDYFDPRAYSVSVVEDPRGPAGGATRVLRGRSFSSTKELLKSAWRFARPEPHSSSDTGFRVVLELPVPTATGAPPRAAGGTGGT